MPGMRRPSRPHAALPVRVEVLLLPEVRMPVLRTLDQRNRSHGRNGAERATAAFCTGAAMIRAIAAVALVVLLVVLAVFVLGAAMAHYWKKDEDSK